MCPSIFLGFFVSRGRELENECVMWNVFFLMGVHWFLFFCVFVFFLQVKSYIDVLEFWKVKAYFIAYFGHDAVLLPVYWAGQKKGIWYRVGERSLCDLSLLFREERSCKKGVNVTFPSCLGCCTCWCLNQCWDTASNIFCLGSGAKWAHFMKGLTEILFVLTYSNRTNLKS